jgi:hypothetical protein
MPGGFRYADVNRKIKDSPMGPGEVTTITEAGFPEVNGVAVAWVEFDNGEIFDPYRARENTLLHREGGPGSSLLRHFDQWSSADREALFALLRDALLRRGHLAASHLGANYAVGDILKRISVLFARNGCEMEELT